jgi:hypothetical protein
MNDIRFKPFKQQWKLIQSPHRFKGAFCGRRSGKTQCGAVQAVMWQEQKPNSIITWGEIDPYLGIIAAPTHEMLRDLSWKKFLSYAKPFIKRQWQSPLTIEWHDGSEIRGVSADRPERLEGKKVHWAWIDEVFQVSEQFYIEMQARTSDTLGYILSTGSLGIQYTNPKAHWAYKYFKKYKSKDVLCMEWSTIDNPYFPKDEIERLKTTLDTKTFKAMFQIDWDTIARNAVYADWSDENEVEFEYDPSLPVVCSIDWGWATQMACLFIQFDPSTNTIRVIDEIVGPKIKLEVLWEMIKEKGFPVHEWVCDIACNKENEQTGFANIDFFEEKWKHPRERQWVRENWNLDSSQFEFQCRSTAVRYGIAIVRRFIRTATGRVRFFVNPKKCPLTLDSIKNYRYPEREGIVLNENPVKENDHCCDCIRYYTVCYHDDDLEKTIEVGAYA